MRHVDEGNHGTNIQADSGVGPLAGSLVPKGGGGVGGRGGRQDEGDGGGGRGWGGGGEQDALPLICRQ